MDQEDLEIFELESECREYEEEIELNRDNPVVFHLLQATLASARQVLECCHQVKRAETECRRLDEVLIEQAEEIANMSEESEEEDNDWYPPDDSSTQQETDSESPNSPSVQQDADEDSEMESGGIDQ